MINIQIIDMFFEINKLNKFIRYVTNFFFKLLHKKMYIPSYGLKSLHLKNIFKNF